MAKLLGWGNFMRHWAAALATVVLISSSQVLADAPVSDRPAISPPSAWVKPLTAAPVPIADGAALHVLLRDVQVSLNGPTTSTFTSVAFHIAKPDALASLGTFAVAWKPDTDHATVHWLRIRRGEKVQDVLALQPFTVLRREQNLEMAALDGVLTATLTIPGLQVGDVLEMAWTTERTEPLLGGHHDLVLDAGTGGNLARLGIRITWDPRAPTVVRSRDLPAPLAQGAGEVTLAASDIAPLVMPQGAPRRYRLGRMVELSDFSSWASVSATFAPLYAAARQRKSGSPLDGEISRIRASANNPLDQASLALKMVEDQIRYLYVGLADSNLRPAKADETWQRRFGDCKAKTALLLALLDGLGIKAEAALVSTQLGDGLDTRLPNAGQFDHVIVRAVISGKTYWLDPTRSGDNRVSELEVPPYHWALPLRPSGGVLEPLVLAAKTAPNVVYDLKLDATNGILVPAVAHAEVRYSGDAAVEAHAVFSALSKGALDEQLRAFWTRRYDFITPVRTSEIWDPQTRSERLVMEGDARMEWNGGGGNLRYELDGAQVGWRGDYRRPPGVNSDAPFAVDFPEFAEWRETIALPGDGRGFSVVGDDVDRTLGGVAIYRRTQLRDNQLTMVARHQPLVAELPYVEAQAANDELRSLAAGAVNLVVDQSRYQFSKADLTAMAAIPQGEGEQGFRSRLFAFTMLGDAKNGLAEAERYLAAFPKSANALVARAMFNAASDLPDAARRDAAAALAIDNKVEMAKLVQDYYSELDRSGLARGSYPKFLAALRQGMAEQCRRRQDFECARFHAEAAVAVQPDYSDPYVTLANVEKRMGHRAAAVAVADRMVHVAPKDADMLAVAGVIYGTLDERDKALDAFARSVAIAPTVTSYINRIRFLPKSDLDARKKDIDAALKLSPDDPDVLEALADWQNDAGDHAGQVATLQKLGAADADSVTPNVNRQIRLGEAFAQGAMADKARATFAEVRGYAAARRDGELFNSLCYAAAKSNFDLDTASSDCARAAMLLPGSFAVLDSIGFVELRQGKLAEAIASYTKGLAINASEPHLLYGRGISYLRQGAKAKGEADIAIAVRVQPDIATEFAAMGVTR